MHDQENALILDNGRYLHEDMEVMLLDGNVQLEINMLDLVEGRNIDPSRFDHLRFADALKKK